MKPTTAPAGRWSGPALRRLVWPLMVEQLLVVSMGIADTVMVASAGEAAVSGVSLVDSINLLLITAFAALSTGGAVVVSQYLGRREEQSANTAARQLLYVVLGTSLALAALGLGLRGPLLRLIYGHIDAAVMTNAMVYFLLSAASYPFLALYTAGAALFRSMGNSKASMAISLLANAVNITGNAVLIFGFGWGVAGAATATLVSRILSAVLIMRMLQGPVAGALQIRGLWRVRLHGGIIRSILTVGVPNGLETSMFQIGKLLVARIVSRFGTAAIAGNAVAVAMISFVTLPGQALGLALLTVAAQCVGAADVPAAKHNTGQLMRWTVAAMAVMALALALLAKPLLGLFGLSGAAVATAQQCIWLFCLAAPLLWPPSFALPNALRAAGDARFTMWVSVLSMWLFRVGFALLLARALGLGVLGVWLAMIIDWVVRGGAFGLRWRSGRWQAKRVLH